MSKGGPAGHKPVSGQDLATFVLSLAACAFLFFFLILPVCCLFPFPLSSAFQLLPCPFSVLPTRNTLLCSFLLPISVKTHQAFFFLFSSKETFSLWTMSSWMVWMPIKQTHAQYSTWLHPSVCCTRIWRIKLYPLQSRWGCCQGL